MPWAIRPPNSRLCRPLGVGVDRVEVPGQAGEGDQVGLGDRPAAAAEAGPRGQRVEVERERVGSDHRTVA